MKEKEYKSTVRLSDHGLQAAIAPEVAFGATIGDRMHILAQHKHAHVVSADR